MSSIQEFCDAMRWAANSDQVGYSQSDRYSLGPDDFYGDGTYNTDCSALVIAALKHAGFETGRASYTGNMSDALCANGWERLPVDAGGLHPGDILLNDSSHVAVWLGDCLAQASIDEHGDVAGGARGDQTGAEVNARSYYDYPWDCILRHMEDDYEELEVPCMEMRAIYQPDGKGYMVYYDGVNLHPLCDPDEMEAVKMFHRKCVEWYRTHDAEDIPIFSFGTPEAPWAHRFEDAISHTMDQAHM